MNQRGFTLLEILVATGVFIMLSSIVVVGINPARQISNTRNAQRMGAVVNIQSAINHYALDGFGGYPAGIDGTLRMIGTSTSSCAVTCGPDTLPPAPPPSITSFSDNTEVEFNQGSHSATQWNAGATALELTPAGLANRTGTYLSKIFDGGSSVSWNTLSWLPRAPYGKELPFPAAAVESGYATNNFSMTNNVLFMKLNETSGAISDVSGSVNNGTVVGTVMYNASGKLRSGIAFGGGSNNYIRVNSASSLNLPNAGGSIMLWIRPTINMPQDTGMGIIRKPDYNGNLYAPGGYGLEIYRNTPGGPQNIRAHLGWNSGLSSSQQMLIGSTNLVSGSWYHVALTWNAGTMTIYVNGVPDATASRTTGPLNWANGTERLHIGHDSNSMGNNRQWFNGTMDEITLWRRLLSPSEVLAAYQRGAIKPKLRARSCDDNLCSGELFTGPDNTANTYYSEETSTSLTPAPAWTPLNIAGRYLQYQLILDTDSTVYGAELASISGGNNGSGGGGAPEGTFTTEITAETCLNLVPLLVPTYITEMPIDPVTGDQAQTYYAVKKLNMDNLTVRACSPELGKAIEAGQ